MTNYMSYWRFYFYSACLECKAGSGSPLYLMMQKRYRYETEVRNQIESNNTPFLLCKAICTRLGIPLFLIHWVFLLQAVHKSVILSTFIVSIYITSHWQNQYGALSLVAVVSVNIHLGMSVVFVLCWMLWSLLFSCSILLDMARCDLLSAL